MKRTIAITVLCIAIGLGSSPLALADNLKEEAEIIVNKARLVMEEVRSAPDSGPAYDLIRQSGGVAIIPEMFKGGFIVGGSYGKGLVVARKDGKWSGPSFVYIGAGSVGFQIGAQITDLILVVVGQNTMDSFLRSNFKLGVDAAVAVGPVGAQATAATEILLKGGIYSYSRAKGLFAGISLEGAGLGTEFDLNRAYYQTTSSPKEILYGGVETPESGKTLFEALNRFIKQQQ
ncbi:MAG: lipid-binding SYLF domain-containing protein [Deltaproteobacteria bacterium]